MRPLEITLLILITGHWLLNWFANRPRSLLMRASLPLALLLTLVVHLWVEQYRWQMLPLYGLALLILVFSAASLLRQPGRMKPPGRLGWLKSLAGILVTALFALLPILLPIPRLAAPPGPYQVGTFALELVDPSRQELYSGQEEPRAIMVQFWYPAVPERGSRPGPWIEGAEIIAPVLSEWLDFPAFFLDHLRLVRSNSYPEAPFDAQGAPYPLIVFSHGWQGLRVQSTFLMEALASQGYVVAAIDHTYGAQIVIFPDGRVVKNNPRALPTNDPPEIFEPAADLLVDQWANDIGFVLDTLAAGNANTSLEQLAGRLDLSRVGVSGHSTGGGAAVEFCGRDTRCKAGLGLDAYLTPVSDTVLQNGVSQPFLFLFSERWPNEKNNRLFARLFPASPQAQEITILGTAHYDFSDLPMLSPLAPYMGLKGPLNAARALQITSDFAVAFFEGALRGTPAEILQGASPAYPEAVFGDLP